MKIKIATGEFQIPDDFELEIEETNPLLSDTGSRSTPISLPGSEHNLALLNNPDRTAIKNRYKTEYNAVIQSGIFQKTCRQIVFSASRDSIETTLYLKESDFYEKIKNTTLPEIFATHTLNKGSISQLITYLDSVMKGNISENFLVFPVVTQFELTEDFEDGDGTVRYRENDVCTSKTHVINDIDGENLIDKDEYNDVETPEGYGITVFPKLKWVLDTVFQHFGFTLKQSLFHTDPAFSTLVLLNSTADTIVKGTINFADVVPGCQVNVFLDCICKKFNCAFEIDVDKGTAEFSFLDEVLANRSKLKDLTPFLTENLTISFVESKQVKLSNAKNFDLTATETKTYNQLLNKYPNLTIASENNFSPVLNNATLRLATGSYYADVIFKSDFRQRTEWLGSNFFEYDAGGTTESETFDTPDECVPICRVLQGSIKNPAAGSKYAAAPTPLAGQRRHVNTVVETDGKEESESTKEQKILFAFPNGHGTYTGWHVKNPNGYDVFWDTTEHWYHASQSAYNHLGIKIRDTGLLFNGEDGLYERFWKLTDNSMKNKYQQLKGIFRFQDKDFFALKFNKLYLLNGQVVIIKSKKYSITKNGIEFKEIELITV